MAIHHTVAYRQFVSVLCDNCSSDKPSQFPNIESWLKYKLGYVGCLYGWEKAFVHVLDLPSQLHSYSQTGTTPSCLSWIVMQAEIPRHKHIWNSWWNSWIPGFTVIMPSYRYIVFYSGIQDWNYLAVNGRDFIVAMTASELTLFVNEVQVSSTAWVNLLSLGSWVI